MVGGRGSGGLGAERDTEWAMSEENVEIATRSYEAATGKDALLGGDAQNDGVVPSRGRVERTRRRNDLPGP